MTQRPAPSHTARLALVPLGVEHTADVRATFGDPGVRRIYGDGRDADPRVEAWIAWSQAQHVARGIGFWAVATADSFVRMCGLLEQTVDGIAELEIGYLLRDAHTGHGYATEAAAFACDYAFATFDVPRVISIIRRDNVPSIRVAERNGFVVDRETRWREQDVRVYAMTRERWSLLARVRRDVGGRTYRDAPTASERLRRGGR
ncbi:MAG: hypothetical protein NVS2B8_04990 [Vulcanimicrobiaceae bacterium]